LTMSGAFGQNLGDYLRVDKASAFTTRTLRHSQIAVTQIVCDVENNGLTTPIPAEDAFLVTLQLRDCPSHELWLDGKPMRTQPLPCGTTSIYDLRRSPMVNSVSAYRNLHFYFSRAALQAAADEDGQKMLDELPHNPGIGLDDPVLRGLGYSLLPAFEKPREANPLFVDHIATAAAAYVAGLFRPARFPAVPGALTKWQESRVKEMLVQTQRSSVAIAQLAKACGLSGWAFTRAFRRTTGQLPHEWLTQYRIEQAMGMLRQTDKPISNIAKACGFSNTGQFSRIFARHVGFAPQAWRSEPR
jgi:AraC-like DNA-binding protein